MNRWGRSCCYRLLTSGGVQTIRLPPKSPNLNAYAERFVRSIKEECLTRVIPLGEGHMCFESVGESNACVGRVFTV